MATPSTVMAGLVPAIFTRTELGKDAIPVSEHLEMAGPSPGSSPAMTGLAARAYVNSRAAGITCQFDYQLCPRTPRGILPQDRQQMCCRLQISGIRIFRELIVYRL